MLTSYNSGAISSAGRPKMYYPSQKHNASTHADTSHNYDSAVFSSAPAGKSVFHMNMVSRLSQEVRTSITTGDIQALRLSVASGEYTPNPMSIARELLFLAED